MTYLLKRQKIKCALQTELQLRAVLSHQVSCILQVIAYLPYTNVLDLYTCDVEYANLALDPIEKRKTKREVKVQRVRGRMAREKMRQMAFDGQL